MTAAIAGLAVSCAGGYGNRNGAAESPEESAKALARSFLETAKTGDVEASKATLVIPFWIDGRILDRTSKIWEGKWREFLGEVGKAEVSGMTVIPFPPEADLGPAATKTYAFVLKRTEKDIRVVDVDISGQERGLGFVCGRGDGGWKILGIDDNKIGPRLR